MSAFRSAAARIASAVDRYLYNAEVEIGCTATLAATLRPVTTAEPVQFDAGENVILRGKHRSAYEAVLEVDGYQPTVTIPALIRNDQTELYQVIRRGRRIAVRLLDDPPNTARIAYEVRRWEPDGRYRALYYLHALGLERGDVAVLGYGAPWGSAFSLAAESLIDINVDEDGVACESSGSALEPATLGFGQPFGASFAGGA